jgi:hypothetical protein
MAAIYDKSAAQGSPSDQHRKFHVGSVGKTEFRPETDIADPKRRLDDIALLGFAIGTGDAAPVHLHRFAFVRDVVPIYREPDKGPPITFKLFEHAGVERGCAGSGIDFGRNAMQPNARQIDQFTPAHHRQRLDYSHGKMAIPSPPSPTFSRRSTVPLA